MAAVSVLIPVYNVEKYLRRCLDSIISQTFTDIEIICVNDGSTDDSLKILYEYAHKDNRIKIIDKYNNGLPSARNAGLDAAKGKYVAFVDSDDYASPKMIEKLYKTAEDKGSEIVICGANLFPETPVPPKWLTDSLSPPNKHFNHGDASLIFNEPSARPFIWRCFVKRDLIERHHMRLAEDIRIGEDNAFQFRLYPVANGITMISDRLYNYCWYREGSMMNTLVYHNIENKFLSHLNMIRYIGREWSANGFMSVMGKEYISYCLSFLYNDLIKLDIKSKKKYSAEFLNDLIGWGYYHYIKEYPDYIRDMFDYISDAAKYEGADSPVVSVVIGADVDYPDIERSISSIIGQSLKDMEILIMNNGASENAYRYIHNFIHKDKRIRLFNMEKGHFSDGYNEAMDLCCGKYILFYTLSGYFFEKTSLEKWVASAEKQSAQITMSRPCTENDIWYMRDHYTDRSILICSISNALFLRSFLMGEGLLFKNYSIESGNVFLYKICSLSDDLYYYWEITYIHHETVKREWLPTYECVFWLDAVIEYLLLSEKNKDDGLYRRVCSMMNSDHYTDLIVNGTRPYISYKPEHSDGSNSQYEVWTRVMDIMGMLQDGSEDAMPKLLYKLVDARQSFLSELSDRYVNKT